MDNWQEGEWTKEDWGKFTIPEIRYLLFVLGLLASVMPWWYVINFPQGLGIDDRTTLLGCLFNADSIGLQTAAILFYLGLATLPFKKIRWIVFGASLLFISFIIGFYGMAALKEGFDVQVGGAQYLGFFVFASMLVIIYARFRQTLNNS